MIHKVKGIGETGRGVYKRAEDRGLCELGGPGKLLEETGLALGLKDPG